LRFAVTIRLATIAQWRAPPSQARIARAAAEPPPRELVSEVYNRLILPFRATNEPPFAFDWVDAPKTERDYGAALVRISREYDRRF
jgi:hypothetical protein